MAEEATEPLAAAGDPGRVLPGQMARFRELVGRDLSARAFAALRRGEPMTRSATATPGTTSR